MSDLLGMAAAPEAATQAEPTQEAPAQASVEAATAPEGQQETAANPRAIDYKGESLEIPDQFWNAEDGTPNIGALMKSHGDLRRQVSEGAKNEAPESYELKVPDTLTDVIQASNDGPLAQKAMEFAKANGLSQDQFNSLSEIYFNDMAASMPNKSDEMAKIKKDYGARTDETLKETTAWVNNLMGKEFADDPALMNAAGNLASTADGVRLLVTLRNKIGAPSIPSGKVATTPSLSPDALRQLQASPEYVNGDRETHRRVAEGWRLLHN